MDDLKEMKDVLSKLSTMYEDTPVLLMNDDRVADVEVISTGSLNLDIAIGAMGFPRGRITEIIGWEGSGKTSVCLSAIANAQKDGSYCAYIDTEQSLNKDWAITLGVDLSKLAIVQPDSAEAALNLLNALVETGKFSIIVLDSVAALSPEDEMNEGVEKNSMGVVARLMSKTMRKNISAIRKSNSAVIMTSQWRNKIGVMFGDPKTTTGGFALQFYANLRVDVVKASKPIEMNGEAVGLDLTFKIIKNKLAVPYKKAVTKFLFNKGFWVEYEVLETATELGIIQKGGGGWYSYGETRLGQGVDKVCKLFEDNPELFTEIYDKIKDIVVKK